jgi:hypothetical protein
MSSLTPPSSCPPDPTFVNPRTGRVSDEVQLRFPARLEYVRITRLVVSGLASQASFTVDETEDVRIAVDELCSTVIDHSAEDGEIVVSFQTDGSTIRMCTTAVTIDPDVELDELSEHILRATVDSHSVSLEGDLVVARMEKTCATPGS